MREECVRASAHTFTMLVLTRRSNESIHIGDDIKVKILSIDRNQIRIGINAPDEYNIVREELINREEQNQEKANG